MIRLVDCQICDFAHSAMRDHCPGCGAKRVILATHSYEPQCSKVTYRAGELKRELVRAYRSNFAFLTAR